MKQFIRTTKGYTLAKIQKWTKQGDGAGSYTMPAYAATKEFPASGGGACVVRRGYTPFYHDATNRAVTLILWVKAICTPLSGFAPCFPIAQPPQ